MTKVAAPPRQGLIRRHLAWSLFALMLALAIAEGPHVTGQWFD